MPEGDPRHAPTRYGLRCRGLQSAKAALLSGAVGVLAGCGAWASAGPERSEAPGPIPSKAFPDRPVALVGDRAVSWDDLRATLAEAAGGSVLNEHCLGLIIDRELGINGLSVTEGALAAERRTLATMLARSAAAPQAEGERLIAEVRRRRGLGEVRFAGLLRRNAGLRALVRAAPTLRAEIEGISDDDVAAAYALRYGPRIRARVIVVPSAAAAQAALARLSSEPFADVAAAVSMDASRDRGGLLDPFSLADPTYPVLLRRELENLSVGSVSGPLSVAWNGQEAVALVRLEERLPADAAAPSLGDTAGNLRAEIRLVRERAAMDRLARRLLAANPPTVIDPSLGWSWDGSVGMGSVAP